LVVQRLLALILLVILAPFLSLALLLVWLWDLKNPFFIHPRIGKGGRPFQMFKMRSMRQNSTRVTAMPANAVGVTLVGKVFRRFKVDEFLQLINVVKGDMLLIGPRPVPIPEWEVYSEKEKSIAAVLPGISDFSSIFWSHLGCLLIHFENHEEAFHRICRPIKSRLALFYVQHRSLRVDLYLLFFNLTNFISHPWTLRHMARLIAKLGDCGVPYEVLSGEKEPYPLDPVR
jgi:lipopolysaccharide/colanic/teichoic acid biosynthesis glycosyltransferase